MITTEEPLKTERIISKPIMELPKPSFAESTILQKPELTLNQELDQMLINHKIPKLHDKVVRGEEMSWNIKV